MGLGGGAQAEELTPSTPPPPQRVISNLEYNHNRGYNYNVTKDRPFSRIMDTAREVLREALPIKCIEAVFLAAYLSCGWEELDRFPVGFKSSVKNQTYRWEGGEGGARGSVENQTLCVWGGRGRQGEYNSH